ncbi:hypothetical protein FRC06_008657 [Ceratobasidium sp. 370]|nr:hypothetical protein FRC06_008657 [Ceratobasidium sp. 370]
MFAPFLKSFLASVHASVGVAAAGVGALAPQWDFKAQLRDWDATFDKILRSLQDKATQDRKARLKPAPRVAAPITPPSDDPSTAPALAVDSPTDAEEIARNVQALKSRLKSRPGPGAHRSPRVSLKGGAASSVGGSDSETSHTPKKKATKTARRWAESALSVEDMAALDYSSAPGADSDIDHPPRPIDLTQLVDESSRGAVGANGLYEVKDLDMYGATGVKDDETEDMIARALNKVQAGNDPATESVSKGALSTLGGLLSRFTGGKVLTAEDLAPVLGEMKEHLMKKNVAKEISDKICESVGESLVGTRVSGFGSIKSETRNALSAAITRILTPKTSTDLLLSIRARTPSATTSSTSPTPTPYVITFVGVNGVGKSTSLGKVAFWLLQNNLRVLVAACDTFRSGAVEQLRVHVRNLGMLQQGGAGGDRIELYEKGYGKDAAGIAREAIAYAASKGFDVVLVDTAGRMQDNEPLMKALAKLVAVNQPDKIIFVGEALVGNEAVDQLSKFDRALRDFSGTGTAGKGRGIDGMLVTKWDTVDDKVGAALSMTYVTGQPIIFVGCGQTYTDLRQLRVQHIVQALLKD